MHIDTHLRTGGPRGRAVDAAGHVHIPQRLLERRARRRVRAWWRHKESGPAGKDVAGTCDVTRFEIPDVLEQRRVAKEWAGACECVNVCVRVRVGLCVCVYAGRGGVRVWVGGWERTCVHVPHEDFGEDKHTHHSIETRNS